MATPQKSAAARAPRNTRPSFSQRLDSSYGGCFPAPRDRPENPEVDIDPGNIFEVALAKLGLNNTNKMISDGLADLRNDLRTLEG